MIKHPPICDLMKNLYFPLACLLKHLGMSNKEMEIIKNPDLK